MDKEEEKQKSHWGPTLENFLKEEEMLDEANAYADEKIKAWEDSKSTKEKKSEEKPMYYMSAENYDKFIRMIFGPEKPNDKFLENFIRKIPPKEKK